MGDLSLNERWLLAVVIGLAFGLFFGIFMRAESIKRKPIYGGAGAHLFHYLAATILSGLIPMIIAAIILHLPILRIMATGLSFSLANFIFLTSYGFFESRAEYVEVEPQRALD